MFSLTCMARELHAALSIASQAVAASSNTPQLKAAMIRVGDTVTIETTNRDQSIRTTLAGEGEGTVLLDQSALASKAALLVMDKPVEIVQDGAVIKIKQGRTKWTMPILAADGFPDMWNDRPSLGAPDIPCEPLFQAFRACLPAVEGGTDRLYLQGLYLDGQDGCTVIGTNGKQMNIVPVPINLPDDWVAPIVPAKACQAIMASFKGAELIAIAGVDRALYISDGRTEFRTQLIEGNFPEWRRFVPTGLPNAIVADGAHLADAARRASSIKLIMQSKSGGGQFVRIRTDGDTITCQASNTDGEEGVDELIGAVTGGGEIGLTFTQLESAIDTLGDGQLRIDFGDTMGSGFIVVSRVDGSMGMRIVSQRRA